METTNTSSQGRNGWGDATNAYVINHAEALDLLEQITTLVQDLPAPDEDGDIDGFMPNWGHVGDLDLLIDRLKTAREALAR